VVNIKRIQEEYDELKILYRQLTLVEHSNGNWMLLDYLAFRADYGLKPIIEDGFHVDIDIPATYPNDIPTVKEVGGRIPDDFHRNANGVLCLGLPIQVKRKFLTQPTLLNFITSCLIPFLYSYSYFEKFGKMPFGEVAHGVPGLISGYKKEFGTNDILIVYRLMKYLCDYSYPGFDLCPCNSGKRLFECHGEKIMELKQLQYPWQFLKERKQIEDFLQKA